MYVARKFRNGGDIGWILKNEKEFKFVRPIAPSSATTTKRSQDIIEQDIYKEQIVMLVSRQERCIKEQDKLYLFIWGQCSDNMQSKL